jgi:hypothetical protein
MMWMVLKARKLVVCWEESSFGVVVEVGCSGPFLDEMFAS